jgi:hypothetical protein
LDSIAVDDIASDAAQGNAGQPGMPAKRASSVPTRMSDQHLRQAEAEHDALHAVEARQRELEADAEHQEHHAEFGQVPRLLGIRHPARGVRPEGGADQQVAHDRRQAEHAEPPRPRQRRRAATGSGQRIGHGTGWGARLL